MLRNAKLLDALIERDALRAKLAEIDKAIKKTAQNIYKEAKGDSILQIGDKKVECRCVRRIAPKYKEMVFELVKGHEERLQELADSDNKRFLCETVSYQLHLIEE
jgi:hypothetical protein